VKGLAFSPLTDIRSFVHNYLLDENLLDVKNLQEQLDTLRHFEDLAADVRERIDSLNKIDDLDKERAANHRRRITNGYIARRARGELHSAKLRNARLKLDETRLAFHRTQSVKLARTIADLAGSEEIRSTHLAEALQYRPKLMLS